MHTRLYMPSRRLGSACSGQTCIASGHATQSTLRQLALALRGSHEGGHGKYVEVHAFLSKSDQWRCLGSIHAKTLRSLPRSFGVVLLELVTGIMPVTRGRVPPPEVPRQCPPDIWDLIQRCMVSKPEARPTAKVRPVYERCGVCGQVPVDVHAP